MSTHSDSAPTARRSKPAAANRPTITLREASAASGIHASVIWRDVTRGTLPAEKIDGTWRVRERDLDAYVKAWHAKPHRIAAGIKHARPTPSAADAVRTPATPRVSRPPRERSSSFRSLGSESPGTGSRAVRLAPSERTSHAEDDDYADFTPPRERSPEDAEIEQMAKSLGWVADEDDE